MIRHRLSLHDRGMTDKIATARPRAQWPVPAALIALSLMPVLAGGIRMAELTGGAEITPDNARFFASPLPVVLHIISRDLYSVLGAFQFVPRFRAGRPGWHRVAGRLLVPAGWSRRSAGCG